MLRKVKWIIDMLRPSARKNRADLIFPAIALCSVVISIATSLYLYQIVLTFNHGLEEALRGILPEVMIYKGTGRPEYLSANEVERIRSAVRDIAPTATYIVESFIPEAELSFLAASGDPLQKIRLKGDFKVVSSKHLDSAALQHLIPRTALETITHCRDQSSCAVAVSRDLFAAMKAGGIIQPKTPGTQPYVLAQQGKKVFIAHIFNLFEGSLSRLAVGSREVLDLLADPNTELDPRPNLVGLNSISDQELSKIEQLLNPGKIKEEDKWQENSLYDTQEIFTVARWSDAMPYSIKKLLSFLRYAGPSAFFFLCLPAMVHIMISLSSYLHNKKTETNLLRVFGESTISLSIILSLLGCLLGVFSCLAAKICNELLVSWTGAGIETFLNRCMEIDFALASIPLSFEAGYFAAITLVFGGITFFTSRKIFKEPASELLDH